MSFALTSTAFQHNAPVPARYTCDGDNVSPPLAWTGVPANAKSLVLIVDDPDAPDPKAPRQTWVHWVIYNLPTTVSAVEEDASSGGPPSGAVQGLNDWKRADYGGPCPPIGRHRYFHKLYALDVVLPNLGVATKLQVEQAMKGHILAEAQLIGTYQRHR